MSTKECHAENKFADYTDLVADNPSSKFVDQNSAQDRPRVIIGFKDQDTLVYHYTKMKTARDFIIPQRTLKIGSILKTNDPKESRNWKFALGTQGKTNLLRHDAAVLSTLLSKALKANTKVACFSQDAAPLTGNHLEDIFLRGWTKPRMWAHYADNHNGVCLVFKRRALDCEIRKEAGQAAAIFRGSVRYVNKTIPCDGGDHFTIDVDELAKHGLERFATLHFEAFVKTLFFEKMTDWRDEREFRWLVRDGSSGDFFVDISGSLVAIIYGESTKPKDIKRIIKQTKDMQLQHMGLKWTNSSPWYEFQNPVFNPFPTQRGE